MKLSGLLIFLLFSFVASAQYPDIHAERPRIYADSARLNQLKNAVLFPGECQSTYNSVVYAYTNWWINDPQLYVLGSDSTQWNWDWSSSWAKDQVFLSVLIFKLTASPLELKRCRFVAREAIQAINTSNFQTMEWYQKENLLRQLSDAGSILLDWCYTDFPAELRAQLAQSQYRMTREFMNTFIYSSAGNSYVSSHNTWNTIFCNQNVLALYQAQGLSAQQQDTILIWYEDLYNKLTNGFIPCWTHYRDDDGGWNWGAAYAQWSLMDQFQLFENMRIATGKNFYTDLPWVQNSINQYLYFEQPDHRIIHLGDGETGMRADRFLYLHARIFNDPRSLWMVQYWSQPALTPNTMDKYTKLLYKDFAMPQVTQPENPTDWWSDKTGLSVSRSSWESDATMVWFFNSPSKKAAHEHRDNNSFNIFKHKPLAIDAGYYDTYGGSHWHNYYTRTIAHNAVCVFDSTAVFYSGGNAVSNDGGQKWSNALANYQDIFAPQNQRGKWISYVSRPDFSFCAADAALSFDTAVLDVNKRRLLFLKPDRVLVLDHLHLKNTQNHQREARWLLHFAKKPLMNSLLVGAEVPDHIETYAGPDLIEINGQGRLALRTLLPGSAQHRLVGGPGYEYWVNGQNYPPLSIPDSTYYTPGNWRLEVIPQNFISDTLIFMHSLTIGDQQHPAAPSGIALRSGTAVAVDWDSVLVVFSASGDTGSTDFHLDSISGNRSLRVLALDLLRNQPYSLFLDNQYQFSVQSDDQGILDTFLVLTNGFHHLALNTTFISGRLTYANSNQSPVSGVHVTLGCNGNPESACVTDAFGVFRLPLPDPGSCTLSFTNLPQWGGVNSTDALVIMRHFVQFSALTGLALRAADADNNQFINSIDALMTAKRYVGAINSFPAGDWCLSNLVFNITGGQPPEIAIQALCTGDVNASFNP